MSPEAKAEADAFVAKLKDEVLKMRRNAETDMEFGNAVAGAVLGWFSRAGVFAEKGVLTYILLQCHALNQ